MRYGLRHQSFPLSHIEPKEDDISALENILLALLHVFSLSLHRLFITKRNQIIEFHDFSTNEPLLEVSVDHSYLGCLCQFSERPAAHLNCSSSEIVDEIESIVAILDDFWESSSSFSHPYSQAPFFSVRHYRG